MFELTSDSASRGMLKCLQMAKVSVRVMSVSQRSLRYTESRLICNNSLSSSAKLMCIGADLLSNSMKLF